MKVRRVHNSRSWSQDSQKRLPVPAGILTESKSRSSSNARRSRTPRALSPEKISHGANENDPAGWRGRSLRHSPTQLPMDKWAVLGNKRRSVQPDTQPYSSKRRAMTTGSRKRPTSGFGSEHYHTPLPRRDSRNKTRPAYLDQDWRQQRVVDSSADEDDLEWVGGWHNFHL